MGSDAADGDLDHLRVLLSQHPGGELRGFRTTQCGEGLEGSHRDRALVRERRGQDDEKIIDGRMQEAVNEMSHYPHSDYLLINDDFNTALAELRTIITSNRLLLAAQQHRYQQLLQELLS